MKDYNDNEIPQGEMMDQSTTYENECTKDGEWPECPKYEAPYIANLNLVGIPCVTEGVVNK